MSTLRPRRLVPNIPVPNQQAFLAILGSTMDAIDIYIDRNLPAKRLNPVKPTAEVMVILSCGMLARTTRNEATRNLISDIISSNSLPTCFAPLFSLFSRQGYFTNNDVSYNLQFNSTDSTVILGWVNNGTLLQAIINVRNYSNSNNHPVQIFQHIDELIGTKDSHQVTHILQVTNEVIDPLDQDGDNLYLRRFEPHDFNIMIGRRNLAVPCLLDISARNARTVPEIIIGAQADNFRFGLNYNVVNINPEGLLIHSQTAILSPTMSGMQSLLFGPVVNTASVPTTNIYFGLKYSTRYYNYSEILNWVNNIIDAIIMKSGNRKPVINVEPVQNVNYTRTERLYGGAPPTNDQYTSSDGNPKPTKSRPRSRTITSSVSSYRVPEFITKSEWNKVMNFVNSGSRSKSSVPRRSSD